MICMHLNLQTNLWKPVKSYRNEIIHVMKQHEMSDRDNGLDIILPINTDILNVLKIVS